MKLRIMIAQAKNSPTQKVWGAVLTAVNDEKSDAVIFYGPGTKLGGSVYTKPRATAVEKYHKKLDGEYVEIYSSEIDTEMPLDELAEKVLHGIQTTRSIPGVIGSLKSADPIIPDPDPVQPKKPKDIAAAIRQIPCGCDWSF
jgi:hypothetical protein